MKVQVGLCYKAIEEKSENLRIARKLWEQKKKGVVMV